MATMNVKTMTAEKINSQSVALRFLKSLGKDFTASEIVIRYARRELALAKDRANRKAGKAARVYVNRNPKALPKKIRAAYAKVAEAVVEMRESTVH